MNSCSSGGGIAKERTKPNRVPRMSSPATRVELYGGDERLWMARKRFSTNWGVWLASWTYVGRRVASRSHPRPKTPPPVASQVKAWRSRRRYR
ncbi:hypothetical protein RvY_08782 [Ramazzottius varieornatus]|uniref:Uncharacterized protein n=1 Tax=Ramazzottius varieornatus TaxID=947166 RepID=A0A1D1V9B2_RAMVA|nr:hypothetical protein RvY_08782 [Ramazzottius varieornatus]